MPIDDVTGEVIGAALAVHRALGPGLLESAYERCLALELLRRGVQFDRQVALELSFEGVRVEDAYRVDLIVERQVVVELKSVSEFAPIHTAQLLTYLRLSGLTVGLLINFNVILLKDGIRRVVLSRGTGGSSPQFSATSASSAVKT